MTDALAFVDGLEEEARRLGLPLVEFLAENREEIAALYTKTQSEPAQKNEMSPFEYPLR